MEDDKELKALAIVREAFADLDNAERERVLMWTASKFKITSPALAQAARSATPPDGETDGRPGGGATDDAPYSEFVDLYDKANPKTAADRALVSAYWVQEVGHQATWPSQPLNDALKNLGYPLTNVTDALTQLQQRKPAQVRQVQKAGSMKQGRKTYKLTVAGINAVRAMVNAAPVTGED